MIGTPALGADDPPEIVTIERNAPGERGSACSTDPITVILGDVTYTCAFVG